jgi:hypothetical protein
VFLCELQDFQGKLEGLQGRRQMLKKNAYLDSFVVGGPIFYAILVFETFIYLLIGTA